jgi:hypothetical protein
VSLCCFEKDLRACPRTLIAGNFGPNEDFSLLVQLGDATLLSMLVFAAISCCYLFFLIQTIYRVSISPFTIIFVAGILHVLFAFAGVINAGWKAPLIVLALRRAGYNNIVWCVDSLPWADESRGRVNVQDWLADRFI